MYASIRSSDLQNSEQHAAGARRGQMF